MGAITMRANAAGARLLPWPGCCRWTARGPAQCRAASVALCWPAPAGRGLAPGAAVPGAELSRGDGCVTGPTWSPLRYVIHQPPMTPPASVVTSGLMPCHGSVACLRCPFALTSLPPFLSRRPRYAIDVPSHLGTPRHVSAKSRPPPSKHLMTISRRLSPLHVHWLCA
jgi:hypothetical protein